MSGLRARIRWWALPAVLLLAAPAAADDADWFVGTWQVSYSDVLFGDLHGKSVEGTAFVTRPRAGPPEVRVTLEDPVSGKRTRLQATRVQVEADIVKLTLRGQSPSLSATHDGKKDVRLWGTDDLLIRSVTPGTVIHTRLLQESLRSSRRSPRGGLQIRVPADPRSTFPATTEIEVELRRERNDHLSGRWSYPFGEEGMYGRRTGGHDRRAGAVNGTESWGRGGSRTILSVTELPKQRQVVRPQGEAPPSIKAVLHVRGWSLPTTEGELGGAVAFEDPMIRFESFVSATPSGPRTGSGPRRAGELKVRVRLRAGVRAGRKELKIGGAPGVWEFRFPDELPAVQVRRRTGADAWTLCRILTPGDVFRVAVEFKAGLPFSHRLLSLRVNGREALTVVLDQDSKNPKLYRSPAITLTSPSTKRPRGRGAVLPAAPGTDVVFAAGDSATPVEWGSISVLDEDARRRPKIIVHPAGRAWLATGSLSAVTKTDPFGIRLRLPEPPGDEPKEIKISVRGRPSESRTIRARSIGGRPDAPVSYYKPRGPVSIARGELETLQGLLQLDLGLVATRDGDIVDIEHGKAKTSVTVYDTRLKQQLGVRKQQLTAIGNALRKIRVAPEVKGRDRQIADLRLQMVENGLALIGRKDFWDLHRLVILETYLNLVQQPVSLHDPGTGGPHPRYGVRCVSKRERGAIDWAIHTESRRRLRDSFTRFGQGVGIALVRFVTEQTGSSGLYTFVTGYNLMGKRVNIMERVLAAMDAYQKMLGVAYTQAGRSGRRLFVDRWVKDRDLIRRRAESKRTKLVDQVNRPRAVRRLEYDLRRAGLGDADAQVRARQFLDRYPELPPDVAAVAAAFEHGVPARTLMQRTGLTRREIAKRLDDFLLQGPGVHVGARRRNMIHRYLGPDGAGSPRNARRRPPASGPDATGPDGLPDSKAGTVLERRPRQPGGETLRDGSSGSRSGSSGSGNRTRLDSTPEMISIDPNTTRPPPRASPQTGAKLEADNALIRASRRHEGRERMNDIARAQDKLDRAFAVEHKIPFDKVEEIRKRRWKNLNELHKVGDHIENLMDWRSHGDYQQASFLKSLGFSKNETVVQLMYARHSRLSRLPDEARLRKLESGTVRIIPEGGRVNLTPAGVIVLRDAHQRIPRELGITRAQWETMFKSTLRRKWKKRVTEADVASAAREYFRFVDGQ